MAKYRNTVQSKYNRSVQFVFYYSFLCSKLPDQMSNMKKSLQLCCEAVTLIAAEHKIVGWMKNGETTLLFLDPLLMEPEGGTRKRIRSQLLRLI